MGRYIDALSISRLDAEVILFSIIMFGIDLV